MPLEDLKKVEASIVTLRQHLSPMDYIYNIRFAPNAGTHKIATPPLPPSKFKQNGSLYQAYRQLLRTIFIVGYIARIDIRRSLSMTELGSALPVVRDNLSKVGYHLIISSLLLKCPQPRPTAVVNNSPSSKAPQVCYAVLLGPTT
jgi:hypothetical protein